MLIALIAAESLLYAAFRPRGRSQTQQFLVGNSQHSARAMPLLDKQLMRKTAGASSVQVFVASKLAEIGRRAVCTRAFEYLLLHLIRTVVLKCRNKFLNTQGRIAL